MSTAERVRGGLKRCSLKYFPLPLTLSQTPGPNEDSFSAAIWLSATKLTLTRLVYGQGWEKNGSGCWMLPAAPPSLLPRQHAHLFRVL